jgi:hypothetical protein
VFLLEDLHTRHPQLSLSHIPICSVGKSKALPSAPLVPAGEMEFISKQCWYALTFDELISSWTGAQEHLFFLLWILIPIITLPSPREVELES